MFRRIVICLPLAIFLLIVSFGEAQQPANVPRIGFLSSISPATRSNRQ
jgi:hypothetical protein